MASLHLGLIAVQIGRILIGLCGLLLIYIALFLREDEEGQLQNRLEQLWIRIDDLEGTAATKFGIFVQAGFRLLTKGFDSIFGSYLISIHAVFVTFCFSVASWTIVRIHSLWVQRHLFSFVDTLLATGLFLIGTSFTQEKSRVTEKVGMIIAMAAVVGSIWKLWIYGREGKLQLTLLMAVSFLGGIVCDFFFVVINRALVKQAARTNSISFIGAVLAANLSLTLLYVYPFVYVPSFPTQGVNMFQAMAIGISSTNVITALFSSAIFALMLAALLHIVMWQFISRPVYAVARHGLIRNKRLMLSTGLILLAWAIPGWSPFLEKLKQFE